MVSADRRVRSRSTRARAFGDIRPRLKANRAVFWRAKASPYQSAAIATIATPDAAGAGLRPQGRRRESRLWLVHRILDLCVLACPIACLLDILPQRSILRDRHAGAGGKLQLDIPAEFRAPAAHFEAKAGVIG